MGSCCSENLNQPQNNISQSDPRETLLALAVRLTYQHRTTDNTVFVRVLQLLQ